MTHLKLLSSSLLSILSPNVQVNTNTYIHMYEYAGKCAYTLMYICMYMYIHVTCMHV